MGTWIWGTFIEAEILQKDIAAGYLEPALGNVRYQQHLLANAVVHLLLLPSGAADLTAAQSILTQAGVPSYDLVCSDRVFEKFVISWRRFLVTHGGGTNILALHLVPALLQAKLRGVALNPTWV